MDSEKTSNTVAESSDISHETASFSASAPDSELETLRAKLSEYETRERRVFEEAALREVFPETSLDAIPDEVYELSRTSLPLAAAYALYLRRAELREQRAKEAALLSKLKSSGDISSLPERDEFSTSEISRMSRTDVRRNYSKILRSLSRK